MSVVSIILIVVSLILLRVAWDVFCITRGGQKTLNERRNLEITGGIGYSIEELHAIGNPFSGYSGRSNL